jgi:hypothetical protein
MTWSRILAAFLLTLLSFASLPAAAAPTAETPHRAAPVSATLQRIYQRAYDEAYSRHAIEERDGTTFVSTGDIDMEWLRDSSAVMTPYIGLAVTDPYVRHMLRGTIERQARYIRIDPYANAFTDNYRVAERKFEMDSLLEFPPMPLDVRELTLFESLPDARTTRYEVRDRAALCPVSS